MPSAFRPGKTPGDLGGEVPACFNAINGGNGICHCVHVEDLLGRVKNLEDKPNKDKNTSDQARDDPWSMGRRVDAEERRAAANRVVLQRYGQVPYEFRQLTDTDVRDDLCCRI